MFFSAFKHALLAWQLYKLRLKKLYIEDSIAMMEQKICRVKKKILEKQQKLEWLIKKQ